MPALISRTRDRSYHDIVQSLLISPRIANDPSVFENTEKAPTIGPSPDLRHHAKQVLTNLNGFSLYDLST